MMVRSSSRFAFGALLALVAFTLPVAADAPTTGPDKQYDDFAEADRTITDRFTKLVWDRPNSDLPYPTAKNWNDARNSCPINTQKPGLMRLPSLKELLSLVDETPHNEYEVNQLKLKMIDRQAFSKTPTDKQFWTSSKNINVAGEYWTVNFADGSVGSAAEDDTRRYRCVEALP